jgi:hypothetical protein
MSEPITQSPGVHCGFQGTPAERVAHLKALRDRVATSKYHLEQMRESHEVDRRDLAAEQPKPEHGQLWIDLKGIIYLCAYSSERYHLVPLNARCDAFSFAYPGAIMDTGIAYYGCSLHELDAETLGSLGTPVFTPPSPKPPPEAVAVAPLPVSLAEAHARLMSKKALLGAIGDFVGKKS